MSRLRRPCKKCSVLFTPTGRSSWLCEPCKELSKMEGHKTLKKKTQERKAKYKIQYFSNKEELDKLRDNITLHRWKILSKNYNLGKRIWGTAFSKLRLSEDMDIPNTTVCRCLALDKINERNWALNKEGKISVFKLAMIASLKNHQFQDQIVDIVIRDRKSVV